MHCTIPMFARQSTHKTQKKKAVLQLHSKSVSENHDLKGAHQDKTMDKSEAIEEE